MNRDEYERTIIRSCINRPHDDFVILKFTFYFFNGNFLSVLGHRYRLRPRLLL